MARAVTEGNKTVRLLILTLFTFIIFFRSMKTYAVMIRKERGTDPSADEASVAAAKERKKLCGYACLYFV